MSQFTMDEKVWQGINLDTFDIQSTINKYKEKFTVTGTNVVVLIYKPELVEKVGSILLSPKSVETDLEYISPIGLVLQVGPEAYKGDQFPTGPYCKEGDWVVIPRGSSITIKDVVEPIAVVDDYKVKMVLTSPKGFKK